MKRDLLQLDVFQFHIGLVGKTCFFTVVDSVVPTSHQVERLSRNNGLLIKLSSQVMSLSPYEVHKI